MERPPLITGATPPPPPLSPPYPQKQMACWLYESAVHRFCTSEAIWCRSTKLMITHYPCRVRLIKQPQLRLALHYRGHRHAVHCTCNGPNPLRSHLTNCHHRSHRHRGRRALHHPPYRTYTVLPPVFRDFFRVFHDFLSDTERRPKCSIGS